VKNRPGCCRRPTEIRVCQVGRIRLLPRLPTSRTQSRAASSWTTRASCWTTLRSRRCVLIRPPLVHRQRASRPSVAVPSFGSVHQVTLWISMPGHCCALAPAPFYTLVCSPTARPPSHYCATYVVYSPRRASSLLWFLVVAWGGTLICVSIPVSVPSMTPTRPPLRCGRNRPSSLWTARSCPQRSR